MVKKNRDCCDDLALGPRDIFYALTKTFSILHFSSHFYLYSQFINGIRTIFYIILVALTLCSAKQEHAADHSYLTSDSVLGREAGWSGDIPCKVGYSLS